MLQVSEQLPAGAHMQAANAWWGGAWSTKDDVFSASKCTMLSSLTKAAGRGQHPLPKLKELCELMLSFATHDEAKLAVLRKWQALFHQDVECSHGNTFIFPEKGPLVVDNIKNKRVLLHIPRLTLCSDCGCAVSFDWESSWQDA
jgi:hypothetical protein